MKIETKILLYLIMLSLVDTFIPIPITAIILLYVLYQKPAWFRELVDAVYRV